MYVPFSVFCVLFVCKCVLCCFHRVSTQLRLNIYRIISYHVTLLPLWAFGFCYRVNFILTPFHYTHHLCRISVGLFPESFVVRYFLYYQQVMLTSQSALRLFLSLVKLICISSIIFFKL
jgi:hypothetical protein